MTSFLLDTHVLLWWAADPMQLSEDARLVLAAGRNQLFVSHVSAWEIAIKESRGRLTLPDSFEALVSCSRSRPLPIALSHIAEIKRLPHIHSDPFDRMLIAQAKADRLTLITKDKHIHQYDVPTLAA